MLCKKCGREIGDAPFCPQCGAAQAAPESVDRVAIRFRGLFKDPLYVILTLLVTALTVVNGIVAYIASKGTENAIFTVIGSILIFLLFAVALWILLFAAGSDTERFPSGGLTLASVLLNILVILVWIGAALLIIAGVLILLLGASTIEALESYLYYDTNSAPFIVIQNALGMTGLTGTPLWITGTIVAGTGLLAAIINALFFGKLHRFTRSLSLSAKSGRYRVEAINASKNWLIVFGIIALAGAVWLIIGQEQNILGAVSQILNALAMFFSSALIRKHLVYMPM